MSPADVIELGKLAVQIAGALVPQIHDYLAGGPLPDLERLPSTLKSRIALTRAKHRAAEGPGA